LDTSQIRTIGFSLIRQPGEFELEIESIKAENTKRTLGDLDLLEDGEFVDSNGNIKRVDVSDSDKFSIRLLTKKQREDSEWLKEYYGKK
jgi:hypothetical protein